MPNKARNDQPEWVIGLKSVIRTTCGPAWRVSPQSGKVKLDIRLDDGSRKYKTLAIPWDRAHGRRIQETIEEIHSLTERGFSIDDAIERVKVTDAPKVANEGNPKLLKDAWAKYEVFKVKTEGILQKTWNKEYGGEAHDEDSDVTPKRIKAGGKTYNNLLKVIKASGPEDMFIKLAQNNSHKAGKRMREQIIRNVAAFLRWGTGYESNYVLPEKWKPFAKGDAGSFIGKKSGEDIKEEKQAIPIDTDDIYKLLESINVNQPNRRHARAAKGWKFMIELASAYGLRPEELKDLEIKDGELWSMWIKKSGGGTGKPRELCSWPEELAEEWDLVNRFKNKEPYPEIKADRGIGEAMSNYLKRNPVWMKMKKEKGYSTRSFRHAYSRRCHKQFGMSSDEVSEFMGHDEATHIANYKTWFKNEDLKDLKKKYGKK